MKKILIVNNNMNIGGVQKSLQNFLWELYQHYDITLLLFSAQGAYMENLPAGIKIKTCDSLFRYLGVSQNMCKKSKADALKRGSLAALTRFLGRDSVMPLLIKSQLILDESYDCAISYLQNGRRQNFYGGTQDFVLRCVRAKKKVAFLHCDYGRCGANYPENNRMLARFDVVAACSEGCRKAFLSVLPEMRDRSVTVPNCHRFSEIIRLSGENPVSYPQGCINILMVCRLTHEKAVDRAILAVHSLSKNTGVKLHIVGDGKEREKLLALVRELEMEETVLFYGEQKNPYRFMARADLLLITSYHEAAPMVIDESACLGLPVLTVETTSSYDMVSAKRYGWVCPNNQDGIENSLKKILENRDKVLLCKEFLLGQTFNNELALRQIEKCIESEGNAENETRVEQ